MDKKTIKLSNILMDYKLDIIPLNEAENRILLLCNSSLQLKEKDTPTFEDYINEHKFKKVTDTEYLDIDGILWTKEEILIIMKPDY